MLIVCVVPSPPFWSFRYLITFLFLFAILFLIFCMTHFLTISMFWQWTIFHSLERRPTFCTSWVAHSRKKNVYEKPTEDLALYDRREWDLILTWNAIYGPRICNILNVRKYVPLLPRRKWGQRQIRPILLRDTMGSSSFDFPPNILSEQGSKEWAIQPRLSGPELQRNHVSF